MFIRSFITLLLSIILSGSAGFGQVSAPSNMAALGSISLTWDASSSTGVTGYKVYQGTESKIYSSFFTIGNQTHYTVIGLTPGTYYFTVSAIDEFNNESDKSNEVLAFISNPSSVFNEIIVTSIYTSSATISWNTSKDCSGIVMYGTDTNNLKFLAANNLGTTSHLVTLTSLTSRTHYLFKVKSTCEGVTFESNLRSFNTK